MLSYIATQNYYSKLLFNQEKEIIMRYNLKINAILEEELYTTPPLMTVVVAKFVGSKRDLPRAFNSTRILNADNNDFRHLRRIKALPNGDILCIICKLNENCSEEQVIKECEDKLKGEKDIFQDFKLIKVPLSAPQTYQQQRACGEIWPCKFAKSKYLISCIDGSIFNEPEKLVMKIIVNNVIEYIGKHRANQLKPCSIAVVFRCNKIYGVGIATSEIVDSNPIKHSAMISIDSVATNAGSGHWKSKGGDNLQESIQRELDLEESLKNHSLDSGFLSYLCTNYDIFMTEEPCCLCSMGLVQSRIRKLFYLDKEAAEQVKCQTLCYPDEIIEKGLLHRSKDLNHRFEAWKVSLLSGAS